MKREKKYQKVNKTINQQNENETEKNKYINKTKKQ